MFFQLSVLEGELGAVKEERDQYKSDIDDSELSKDQLIKKAWEVRDAAVKRKNTAEIDLAKERIATMQINSQVRQTQKLSNLRRMQNSFSKGFCSDHRLMKMSCFISSSLRQSSRKLSLANSWTSGRVTWNNSSKNR